MTQKTTTHRLRLPMLMMVALCLAAGHLATGCKMKRNPEELEEWRPSKARNGLEKLQEWIADPGQKMPTRMRAIEILLEEEYALAVAEALKKAPEGDRVTMLGTIVPQLDKDYQTKDANIDTYSSGRSKQVKAKDALFYLLPVMTKAEDKEMVMGHLEDWMKGGHYHERDQMGKVNYQELIDVLGPRAAPPLLSALEDPKNQQAVLAKLLGSLKDPKVDKKVAQTLVMMANKSLPKLDKDLEAAILQVKDEAVVPLFVRMVPNEAIDGGLRTTAVQRIQEIKGPSSMPIFLNWIKDQPELLRWVSVQAIAETRGKAGLGPILANLPTDKPYGEGDEEGFKGEVERLCSEEVKKGMKDTEPIFIQHLSTGSWPAKAVSLGCLQFVGTKKARPAVEKLLKDKTEVPSWGADVKTLGDLAKATLDKLPK